MKLPHPERFGLVMNCHKMSSWLFKFFPLQIFNFIILELLKLFFFSFNELMLEQEITVNNILLKSNDQARLDSTSAKSEKIGYVATTT